MIETITNVLEDTLSGIKSGNMPREDIEKSLEEVIKLCQKVKPKIMDLL